MSLRINLTWLLAVLTPATESKIGNSTKDIKVESLSIKTWTFGLCNASRVRSSQFFNLVLSSFSQTIEFKLEAPVSIGKWNKWLMKWLIRLWAASLTGDLQIQKNKWGFVKVLPRPCHIITIESFQRRSRVKIFLRGHQNYKNLKI